MDQNNETKDLKKLPEKYETTEFKNRVMGQLKTVIDPELRIDIVNLGLVYEIDLYEEKHCMVTVTLTTVGCPLADIIFDDVRAAVLELEEIDSVDVNLTWYPPWDPSKMSRYARIALGVTL